MILESHHSTHIEGTALSLEQAKSILEGKKIKGVNRDDEKELLNYKKAVAKSATDPTKHYVLL